MNANLRSGVPEDAPACGLILFQAFKAVADQHNFPWDFPSVEIATGVTAGLLSHPDFYSVVAEIDGRVVGSNFLDERNQIAGIGPITVDPGVQNLTVGRQLMAAVIERAAQRKFAGVRLVQAAYHNRSLCLYTKLGFATRETLSKMDGAPLGKQLLGYQVRMAIDSDRPACNRLCLQVHGHNRDGELHDAIKAGTAKVVEHLGQVTGYATDIAFFAHAVGETTQDIIALISSASDLSSKGGVLVPTRNSELFRWCLDNGLRLVHQMTLMTTGLYNEPVGAYLPSVLY
jgi:predicted N-acetyltransferase YhbS